MDVSLDASSAAARSRARPWTNDPIAAAVASPTHALAVAPGCARPAGGVAGGMAGEVAGEESVLARDAATAAPGGVCGSCSPLVIAAVAAARDAPPEIDAEAELQVPRTRVESWGGGDAASGVVAGIGTPVASAATAPVLAPSHETAGVGVPAPPPDKATAETAPACLSLAAAPPPACLRPSAPPPACLNLAAAPSPASLSVGDRVRTAFGDSGVVRFVGRTHFGAGEWVGIQLDQPRGKNDGTVLGVSYFGCEPRHGLFTRAANLVLLCGGAAAEAYSPWPTHVLPDGWRAVWQSGAGGGAPTGARNGAAGGPTAAASPSRPLPPGQLPIRVYVTSTATDRKVAADCRRVVTLLAAKKVPFDIVDLAADRAGRGGARVDRAALLRLLKAERLPRVHLGEGETVPSLDAAVLQDLEDHGELDAILRPLLAQLGLGG